jgi:hypothetical protein
MKTHYLVLAILSALMIIATVTSIITQQVFAPRECPGCAEFKKLTHEFEKDVLDAAIGDPNIIPGLLEQYSSGVRALDFTG